MFDFGLFLKKIYEKRYTSSVNMEMDRILSIASECLQRENYVITTEEVNRLFDKDNRALKSGEPLILSYKEGEEYLYDGALDLGKRRVLFFDDGKIINFTTGEARIPALYGYVYLPNYAAKTVRYYSIESIEYITAAMGTYFADPKYSAKDLDEILSFVLPESEIRVERMLPETKIEAAIKYAADIAKKQEKEPEMGLK